MLLSGGAEEMVEAHVVQGGGRGEAGDVAAQLRALPVAMHHHGQGIPADERADAALEGRVAGRSDLARGRDAVDVRGGGVKGQVGTRTTSAIDQLLKQEMRAFDAGMGQRGFQGVDPFLRFLRIDVARFLFCVCWRVSLGRFPLSHRCHSPFAGRRPDWSPKPSAKKSEGKVRQSCASNHQGPRNGRGWEDSTVACEAS